MSEIAYARPLVIRMLARLKKKRRNAGRCVLASLHAGTDTATDVYIAAQGKIARELDIEYRLYRFPRSVSCRALKEHIEMLNEDRVVKGVIVHQPLPRQFDRGVCLEKLSPSKDIEGVAPDNLGRLLLGRPLFIPPTVSSILYFLKQSKVDLYGKDAVIVGFSPHIGRPLSLILGARLATVTIAQIGTYEKKRLPAYIRAADIVISCVGKADLIRGEWIKKGAVVIDVGISRHNGKLSGDVEFAKAVKRAAFITPVPGGVGALTPLFLYENLLKAAAL